MIQGFTQNPRSRQGYRPGLAPTESPRSRCSGLGDGHETSARHSLRHVPEPRSDDEQLLSNVIQCLDRLYDEQTGVVDVRVLLIATAAALGDSTLSQCMVEGAERLGVILASGDDAVDQNRAALVATDDVRKMVARSL